MKSKLTAFVPIPPTSSDKAAVAPVRRSVALDRSRQFKLSPLLLAMLIGFHMTPSEALYEPPPESVVIDPPPLPVPLPNPPIPSNKANLLGFTLFKGDLHNHARGHGIGGYPAPRRSADSVFQMARATGGDFLAITNHDLSATNGTSCPGGEVISPMWPINYPTLYECWKLTPWASSWLEDIDTNDALAAAPLNTNASFVALVGYERTGKAWNHLNVFNMREWIHDGSIVPGMEGDVNGNIQGVVNRINEGKDPIISINHPTLTDWNSLALVPVMASKTHLLELGMADSAEASAFPTEPFSSTNIAAFKLALLKGWKVSPSSNSDAHTDYGSTAFPGNFRDFENRTGIALPIGAPLTQGNLFAAMKQHRTFASSSPYLSTMMLGRSQPMGSTVSGTSALPFVLDALYSIPAGAPPAVSRNVCNVELWSSGNAHRALRTFYFGQPYVSLSFTLNTPFFKDYFFRVNARQDCNNAGERWASLITAPIWTDSQLPKPQVTSPGTDITVTQGSSFTVAWSNSGSIPQVKLQVYRGWEMVPQGSPLFAANAGQYTWSTAGWATGTYYIGVTDSQYPGFEWWSRAVTW